MENIVLEIVISQRKTVIALLEKQGKDRTLVGNINGRQILLIYVQWKNIPC